MNNRRKRRRQRDLTIAVGETRKYWRKTFASDPHYWEKEIIVDNFAGGGGASTGIEQATGRSVDVAINHDPAAIAMHEANHPDTRHYCENVWDIDPREVAAGRPVGLVWLSPDCTHHSKARGGKPRKKNIRGLAWVAVRWAATVRPRVIHLENVEEFKGWGPLTEDDQPDPKQKGRTFNSFVNALKAHGYEVEWREMRACDYGTPTIRKRFFLVARCDGRPIVWPEPTHGAPDTPEVIKGKRQPWKTAADIIDWSIPCPSIFTRKKALAENTLRRIARGLMKFVINNPNPFIVTINHSGEGFRGQEIDKPLGTMTAKNGYGLVTPYITRIGQTGFGGDRLSYDVTDPLTTITTKNEHMVIVPHITKFRSGATGSAMDEPLHTITSGAGSVRPAGAAHAMGVVTAFLAQYHTETTDSGVRGQSMDDPLLTQDTSNRYAVVSANIVRHFGESIGSGMKDPIGTITAGGGGKSALVTSNLIKFRGTNIGQPVDEPLHTITAGGNHHAEVRAFLIAYYGASTGQSINDPLHTVPTHDRFGLVTIHDNLYQIVDIGMRMLEPHELYAAQGFPSNYIIKGYHVNGKPVTKSDQVARCGNSVPPQFAEALVRANLPEHCTGTGKRLTYERYKETSGQLQLSM
jgi:DNA (cytosine-5)-methyltransferase 1